MQHILQLKCLLNNSLGPSTVELVRGVVNRNGAQKETNTISVLRNCFPNNHAVEPPVRWPLLTPGCTDDV